MDVSTDLGHKSASELFTPDQYQSLLALIQQNHKPSSSVVHASNMVQSSTSNYVLENSHMMPSGNLFLSGFLTLEPLTILHSVLFLLQNTTKLILCLLCYQMEVLFYLICWNNCSLSYLDIV